MGGTEQGREGGREEGREKRTASTAKVQSGRSGFSNATYNLL